MPRVILVKDGKKVKEADINDLPLTLSILVPLKTAYLLGFIDLLERKYDVEVYECVYVNLEQTFSVYQFIEAQKLTEKKEKELKSMAQELPFLNLSETDIKALTPINSQCTVLCEIEKIFAKEGKGGGTTIYFNFVCIDDNSPEKGRPAIKAFPLGYPLMMVPLLLAAKRITKEELAPGAIDLEELKGKQLMIKFDLRDNGRDEFTIQPVEYYRSDKPLA